MTLLSNGASCVSVYLSSDLAFRIWCDYRKGDPWWDSQDLAFIYATLFRMVREQEGKIGGLLTVDLSEPLREIALQWVGFGI